MVKAYAIMLGDQYEEQAMKKIFVAMMTFLFVANFTSAQAFAEHSNRGHNPYVMYELKEPIELDENPWRVVSVERFDIDLTQAQEPEVCVVQLELITPTDPVLSQDFQEVSAGDFEVFWNGKWILASEFENQMDESGCSFEGTLS